MKKNKNLLLNFFFLLRENEGQDAYVMKNDGSSVVPFIIWDKKIGRWNNRSGFWVSHKITWQPYFTLYTKLKIKCIGKDKQMIEWVVYWMMESVWEEDKLGILNGNHSMNVRRLRCMSSSNPIMMSSRV